jgi:hypothetical protein
MQSTLGKGDTRAATAGPGAGTGRVPGARRGCAHTAASCRRPDDRDPLTGPFRARPAL